ncbi:capsid cement protein [Microbacterium sp. SORGH_AS_0862]|uniref:capsid cement protein n=1 Tax=Microbacterium sp. SORGH_AS_0862 TaxID=3041789 RepID=UPI00278F619F|nr:capsid cement protein [Microbacterium sp. SORGH_AS_0862]MDQ1206199.1 hypothetical protein [Microbacterium sp. SORGH_AS_0862]
MPKNYLPLYRPGQVVSFGVTAAVTAGQVVEVGSADFAIAPAAAASTKVVGVAGHDAGIGDKAAVEVNKAIHELKAVGAVTRGQQLEAAASGGVRTLASGKALYLALASAVDGALVPVIQL